MNSVAQSVAHRIRYLVMDVDGTLTDGKIYIASDGREMKAFDVKDGYAIRNILPSIQIEPIVITGRKSEIVSKRCEELDIRTCHQGVTDKCEALGMCVPKEEMSYVAYIGDDLNDLPVMIMVKNAGGIIGCPADAVTEVIELADCVTIQRGGEGAVRGFVNWLKGVRSEKMVNM